MYGYTEQQLNQLRFFRECFIEHSHVENIYNIFDRLMLNSSLGGEQESLLLTGDTGSGKKSLIDNYVSKYPRKRGTFGEIPVLSTHISTRTKEQNILDQILIDLEDNSSGRVRRSNNSEAFRQGVVAKLRRKNVKLIIINRFHKLIELNNTDPHQQFWTLS